MARILGVDYGTKRLGFAVSDPGETFSFPLKVVAVNGDSDAVRRVVEVSAETGAQAIVLGMPLNMNGTSGPAAANVAAFAERLRAATGMAVHTSDERLSTALVERAMIDSDVRRSKRKAVVDKLAAQVILQGYLDSRRSADEPAADDGTE